MTKIFIFTSLLFLSLSAFAQDVVTITDPEIEFSLSAPNDWFVQDDGFYYILVIPSEDGLDHLSITYFETNETSPDDQFEGLIKADLPLNEKDYKLLQTGDDTVDSQPAKWAIYNSTFEGTEMKSIVYIYISCGQIFKIRAAAKRKNFENYQAQFERTIRSLKARRI